MPDAPISAAQFREEQVKEYGVYVAAQTIFIEGARAFNAGDPVPASHVERGVVAADEVAKVSTKAGQAIAAGSPTESKG
jgi:hypothetical protein